MKAIVRCAGGNYRIFGASVGMASIILAGCVASQDEITTEHEIALLGASPATTSELGIVAWNILEGEQGIRILGKDNEGVTHVETFVHQISAEEVQLDFVSPVSNNIRLHLNGEAVGATSDEARRIAAAVYKDLGGQTRTITASSLGASENIESAELALSIATEGHIAMPWSFFGYVVDEIVGIDSCNGTRAYYDAYPSTSASCWVTRWATDITGDCRILLHRGIVAFKSDTCHWYVYKN